MKDFNFLPKGYSENLRRRKSRVWTKKIIVPYIVVVSLMIIVPIGINMKLKYDKTKAQNEVRDETYYKSKSEQYRMLQSIYKQREEQYANLSGYGIDPTNILEDLQNVMPDNMYIEYLNMSKLANNVFELRMKCIAKTKEDAATFLEVLRKDVQYHDAHLTAIDENAKRDTIEFTFSCLYETKRG